jgi:hypothetical protein
MLRPKITRAIASVVLLSPSLPLYAGNKPPFSYSYAAADYTCRQLGKTTTITTFSQVFPVCYQDGRNHQTIAYEQIRSAEQSAKAMCPAGPVTYTGVRQGVASQGPGAEGHATNDRNGDINSMIRLGNATAIFYVSAPYSGKCQ